MPRPIPEKLSGVGRKVATINAIIDKLREMELRDTSTVKVTKRPSGTTLESKGGTGTGGGDENVWM